ncbi:hypothetical protein [Pontibacillus salipaludis]|uniref:hypothetical protein n=1 Tax=Pontibacillus salipaludis TaxID=1697394 RepID=UPI00166754B7|nr:hypothetical protein [Pontibacillus salipaludis]
MISGKHVIPSNDLEADNHNLVGRDGGSGGHHLHQNYAIRPVPGYLKYHTPIDQSINCIW